MKKTVLFSLLIATCLIVIGADKSPPQAKKSTLPTGAVIMWYGPADQIPPDWMLCDGSQGTPDLRGMFIVGAGDAYLLGTTGGSENHHHDINITTYANPGAGITYYATATRTELASNLPPYTALHFICKQ